MNAILISFIISLGVLNFLARSVEKKKFNNGICSECGGKWEHFDTDSQGGRGYRCLECNRYIWISYKVDKIKTA